MENNIIVKQNEFRFLKIRNVKLFVMKSGLILRFFKTKGWRIIQNINNKDGYNRILLNKKKIRRHRILGYAFLNLDINNKALQIDHIDGNKLNNHINNLRIVTHQQNHFNRTSAKGYSWSKKSNKWYATICANSKQFHLGSYLNEQDARQAYLTAKLKFHLIHN